MTTWRMPNAQQLIMVTDLQTPYATGKIALCKAAVALSQTTVKADLSAVEADFTGYAKKTLTAVGDPFIDPSGGVSFIVPTQQWDVDATPTVLNDIYGGWIEDSGGVLLLAFMFASAVPMNTVGQALALQTLINFFGTRGVIANVNGNTN